MTRSTESGFRTLWNRCPYWWTWEYQVDFHRGRQTTLTPGKWHWDSTCVFTWTVNWTDITTLSRLYLLRRLRSFRVQGALVKTFFDSVVVSAFFCGVAFWNSSLSTAERKHLDKLISKAASVLGWPLLTQCRGEDTEELPRAWSSCRSGELLQSHTAASTMHKGVSRKVLQNKR